MKIQITAGGIYDGEGKEVPIGTTFDVKDEPRAWKGRYNVVSEGGEGKTPVTNPDGATGFAVAETSPGWFVINKDGQAVTKKLRQSDLEGFDGLSDEDKAAFADLHKQEA